MGYSFEAEKSYLSIARVFIAIPARRVELEFDEVQLSEERSELAI